MAALGALALGACGSSRGDPVPALLVHDPGGAKPTDPLAGTDMESCAVFLDEQCTNGVLSECNLYDVKAQKFPSTIDPLVRRVFLFERWYDLYHQPDGQTANRVFTGPTPAGTPEAQWGALDHFAAYDGVGDSAIWTGAALNAYALRYLVTGTEADYERMVTKTTQLLTLFDVTGIPGYLARYHGLIMAPGAPKTDEHIVRYNADFFDDNDHYFDPANAPGLPDVYRDGIIDGQGKTWDGTPYWHGHPSIDQYSGPMTAFPLVFGLLRDEDQDTKDRITHEMTCYLNRLGRIEIRNLQQNQEALDAVRDFFSRGLLRLDPGDLDLSKLDTVVAYANRSINSTNEDTFDRSCPDAPTLKPYRVLDATSDDFILDLLTLAKDLQGDKETTPESIDHIYVVSVRGADAMHMIHLAAMAYYFTGREVYRSFLYDELIGNLHALQVANLMSSLRTPRWCRSFYGSHITFSPFWSLLELLDDSPLRTELAKVMDVELEQKDMYNLDNAKFDFMYAGTVPDDIATAKAQAVAEAIWAVETLGGNGGVLDAPRRTYDIDRQWLLAHLPDGNEPICPTEDERAFCEDGFKVFGVRIPGRPITSECTGAPGECQLSDGCAQAQARDALPMRYRPWTDLLWQRNPFEIGAKYSIQGQEQSPGLDLTEAYWLGRRYGYITSGRNLVLAWRNLGNCQ